MRYKQLEKCDLKLSVVGLGTWALGGAVEGSDSWGVTDDGVSINTIRRAIECGINLIDTSPSYGIGHSEEVIGKAIKGLRDKAVIVTKCGTFKKDGKIYRDLRPEAIRKQIDESLSRLDIDTIDIYLIHWPDISTPLEVSLEELEKLKKAGKFRYLGVSNFSKELLGKAAGLTDLVAIQPQYSLLARDSQELIGFCKDLGIGVMTYGSLGAGILSGKYTELPTFGQKDIRDRFYRTYFTEPMFGKSMELVGVLRSIAQEHGKPVSHVAINWVAQQSGVTTAIVGAKNEGQIEENALAASWELSNDELARIDRAYAQIFGAN